MTEAPDRFVRLLDPCRRAAALAPAEQLAFVRRERADDPALGREVLAHLETDDDQRAIAAAMAGTVAGALDWQPERLGDYRILHRIGRGGAGVVYAAEHVHLARWVALKTIRHDFADSDAARTRFRREMSALMRLEHPHICRVYELGEDGGVPFMTFFSSSRSRGARVRSWSNASCAATPCRCITAIGP